MLQKCFMIEIKRFKLLTWGLSSQTRLFPNPTKNVGDKFIQTQSLIQEDWTAWRFSLKFEFVTFVTLCQYRFVLTFFPWFFQKLTRAICLLSLSKASRNYSLHRDFQKYENFFLIKSNLKAFWKQCRLDMIRRFDLQRW